MIKKLNKYVLMAVAALALFSCAEEKDDTERAVQERMLDAYVEVKFVLFQFYIIFVPHFWNVIVIIVFYFF